VVANHRGGGESSVTVTTLLFKLDNFIITDTES